MSDHDHEHDHEQEHDHEHDEEAAESHRREELELLRRRALAQIRQYPDVALRMPAREVEEFDEYLVQLVERMIDLMHEAQGVGLAAPQIGVLQRVFVFAPEDEPARAIVNPILTLDGEKVTEDEGCLSMGDVRVPVERSARVVLEGKDPNGDDVRYELDDLGARVVQHENDHLDGVLILDRTDADSRKQALGELRPQPTLA